MAAGGGMTTLRNTIGALGFMALFFGAIAITAGEPSDVEALADTAMSLDDAVIEARINAMSQTENERRAWAVCRGWHAERAVILQLEDSGEYVCHRSGGAL